MSRRVPRSTFGMGILLVGSICSCGSSSQTIGLRQDAAADGLRRGDAAPDDDDGSTEDSGAGSVSDAATCQVVTSRYDHSCNVDSDCVSVVEYDAGGAAGQLPVQSGNYCDDSECICAREVLSKAGADAYARDVLLTPLGSGALPWPHCGCVAAPVPACVSGICTTAR